MSTLYETKAILRGADAVCFDVDSTVITDEGIDELAKFCGVGDEVTEWTKRAMGGGVSFRTALRERLNIIQPTCDQIAELLQVKPPQLTPGIRELVSCLQRRGAHVFLVSGGFRCLVEIVGQELSIPPEDIYANRLSFFYNGEYAGFDESQLTSESGGKGKVIAAIKAKYGYKQVVMIGDGATDMEACPPADAFIGFGGNAVRSQVQENSKWFVTSFHELLHELQSANGCI
ncbi:phosphoserine phosphatase [Lethenteron reissneri]|uniref:phosphoserine phosphatase n=1 Tax=Lethenteron reissneri TaxID=7753 RepID=UPI002AB6BFA0|nr:phosphoserine phosphatase [Lethenteron reissneri]